MIESYSLCEIVWVLCPILVPQMLFLLKNMNKNMVKNQFFWKTNNLNTIYLNLLHLILCKSTKKIWEMKTKKSCKITCLSIHPRGTKSRVVSLGFRKRKTTVLIV